MVAGSQLRATDRHGAIACTDEIQFAKKSPRMSAGLIQFLNKLEETG
jgi:hypothetical protein